MLTKIKIKTILLLIIWMEHCILKVINMNNIIIKVTQRLKILMRHQIILIERFFVLNSIKLLNIKSRVNFFWTTILWTTVPKKLTPDDHTVEHGWKLLTTGVNGPIKLYQTLWERCNSKSNNLDWDLYQKRCPLYF